ncbi:MAG: hypothetical protein JNL01_09260 [Bdellovibrionales bacterium]|nr:hypothetical protein [Bdellovibrionales bacterium]
MRSTPDYQFVSRAMLAQMKRCPASRDLYRFLANYYAELRKREAQVFRPYLNQKIPPKRVADLNRGFEGIHSTLGKLTRDPRAQKILKARLGKSANFKDLLKLDVYRSQTYEMDFTPKLILGAQDPSFDSTFTAMHIFAHRVQQTRFIYFHEIVVGNLIVKTLNPKWPRTKNQPERHLLDLYARILNRTHDEVLALHVLSEKDFLKQTPKYFHDLLDLCAHFFWFLEAHNLRLFQVPTTEVLTLMLKGFAIPLAENFLRHPRRAKPKAWTQVDTFFRKLAAMPQVKPRELENLFRNLAEAI